MNKIINNCYFKSLICLLIYFILILKVEYLNFLLIYFCKHNYYKIKEIDPTEEFGGKTYFTCGFCGKNKTEEIPKLNEDNYFI